MTPDPFSEFFSEFQRGVEHQGEGARGVHAVMMTTGGAMGGGRFFVDAIVAPEYRGYDGGVYLSALPWQIDCPTDFRNSAPSKGILMPDQIPFGTNDFAENPEPRCPCVLLLDVSGSMGGQPITELNAGMVIFKDELSADSLASKRVEVAVVSFGGSVQTVCDFTTVASFTPPALQASGDTPMGAAIHEGLDMLRQRKDTYKTSGIAYFRPWVFLITDGAPTDEWGTAAQKVKQGEDTKAFAFFTVGVEGANFDILKQLGHPSRQPLKLKELRFRDLFVWLSASLKSVSRSNPGDAVPLANPTGPSGWASV
jgi:uncharacterized protein YegL